MRQVLYGTSQRALARCACAQRTGFLIKFFNQESVLQGNGRKKAQPQGRAAETVTMFENPPAVGYKFSFENLPLQKEKADIRRCPLYVGTTYFSGPSPAKYRGQKRA